jgi:uroporphyrin-III C-methyltransferase
MKGKVYLVGAGPGDPDLLTVKAVRTLKNAEVVLHDALVSAEVLSLIAASARVVDVGKRCGQKWITQDEINRMMVQFATSGLMVVRLKSGDPLVFGRAGEEIEALRRDDIEFEIVPGISALLAGAAAARISLTDRRCADQLLVVSGHRGHGKAEPAWQHQVTNRTTVVIYMPGDYGKVQEFLLHRGLSHSTPCVIVSKASGWDEHSHATTLGSLENAPSLPAPCVLIVGETVARVGLSDVESLWLNTGALHPESVSEWGFSAET